MDIIITSGILTRPADTPGAYSVGDAIGTSTTTPTLLEIPNCTRAPGGSGYIRKVRLLTNSATFLYQIRLWMYLVSTATIAADHAQFNLLWANRANRIGCLDLPTLATEPGGSSDSASAVLSDIAFPFRLPPSSRSLYLALEAKVVSGAPASGQLFFVEFNIHPLS